MIQSFDTQLQAVLRALNDVVVPALGGADKHVLEQLHLSVATLSFIKTRLPAARRFCRMELSFFAAFALDAAALVRAELPRDAAAIDDTAAQAKAMLDRPDVDTDDYQVLTRRLREQIAALAAAAVGMACKHAVDALILDRSDVYISQNRQWCLPFGFELKPDELAPAQWDVQPAGKDNQ